MNVYKGCKKKTEARFLSAFKQAVAGIAHVSPNGKRLRFRLRQADTIARFGGDEFVVMIDEAESRETVNTAAKTIIDTVCEAFYLEDDNVAEMSCSVGIALFPKN